LGKTHSSNVKNDAINAQLINDCALFNRKSNSYRDIRTVLHNIDTDTPSHKESGNEDNARDAGMTQESDRN